MGPVNIDFDEAGIARKLQLLELDEIRRDAYESSRIYKEKPKAFHDRHISKKSYTVGQKIWWFNSRLKLFLDFGVELLDHIMSRAKDPTIIA
ncbi:hypothetical protein Tco_1431477 [Tanacetum coccineum]